MLFVACAARTREQPRETTVRHRASAEVAIETRTEPRGPTLEEDTVPSGAACESSDACGEDHCRGPAGCSVAWACGEARACGASTISYCGCDGVTFYALENCPRAPIM